MEKLTAAQIASHVLLPALVVLAFFAVALSPVHLLGCKLRGLIAFALALCSGIYALVAAARFARARAARSRQAQWWFANSAILMIPVVAMLLMA